MSISTDRDAWDNEQHISGWGYAPIKPIHTTTQSTLAVQTC